MDDLTGARTRAEQATQRVSQLEQNAPEMLRNLKSNLTSIFAKDNPLIQAREGALSDFLAAPSRARADMLPSNLPVVAGSNLNLSPTQLSAVENSRTAAAFAPLSSLNQLIVGQYGNLGDILKGAASQYQAQVDAARTAATGAQNLYTSAIDEYNARKPSGSGFDSSTLALLLSLLNKDNEESSDNFWEEEAGLEVPNIDPNKAPKVSLPAPTNTPSATLKSSGSSKGKQQGYNTKSGFVPFTL